MSGFRVHARNHLRTAAGTYIWAETDGIPPGADQSTAAPPHVRFDKAATKQTDFSPTDFDTAFVQQVVNVPKQKMENEHVPWPSGVRFRGRWENRRPDLIRQTSIVSGFLYCVRGPMLNSDSREERTILHTASVGETSFTRHRYAGSLNRLASRRDFAPPEGRCGYFVVIANHFLAPPCANPASVRIFPHDFKQGYIDLPNATFFKRSVFATALLTLTVACAGPPISLESPPLSADGQSRVLFVQVVSEGVFVGELYARKAGAGSWGTDLVFVDNIYPGNGRAFNLDDGSTNCRFDLRRRVFGGSGPPELQDQMNVDLCKMNKAKQVWLL
jgi:hypothetical protein